MMDTTDVMAATQQALDTGRRSCLICHHYRLEKDGFLVCDHNPYSDAHTLNVEALPSYTLSKCRRQAEICAKYEGGD